MEREIYFWYSKIRRGFVVYAMGFVQSTSYSTVRLLKQDWPNAIETVEGNPHTVPVTESKLPLPYWLGGEREISI